VNFIIEEINSFVRKIRVHNLGFNFSYKAIYIVSFLYSKVMKKKK